jgi:transcriptional regulator with XRE-family HTH domain
MARRELTAVKLADLLGVSDMWVIRRMRGKTQITMEDLERLAAALDVPVSSFLRGEPTEVAS